MSGVASVTLGVMAALGALLVNALPAQAPEKGTGSLRHVTRTILPSGDLFRAPLADPREPRFHQSVVQIHGGSVPSRVWLADHGESTGLLRIVWSDNRGALQIGVLAAKFGQFDLQTESNDLVNADYMFGIPVTFKRGRVTGRMSLYHVSSHLGDEFLLGAAPPARVNVSVETLDLRVSREWSQWRLYGGGEMAIRRSPSDLLAGAVHGGVELRRMLPGRLSFTRRVGENAELGPVAAVDLSAPGSSDGGFRVAAKGGLELTATGKGSEGGLRSMSVLFEYFRGPSQFGQFYREQIRYSGLAVQFTL